MSCVGSMGCPGRGKISRLSEQDEAEDHRWVKLVAYLSPVKGAGGKLIGKPAALLFLYPWRSARSWGLSVETHLCCGKSTKEGIKRMTE